VLEHWPEVVGKFVKVMPNDYKRALAKLAEETKQSPAEGVLEVAHG
jgi:glutamate synthase domain-containing protein 3